MKSMTCKQLGGACDKVFTAATFDEIAKMSKDHGTEMYKLKDQPHMDAMSKMMDMMHNPKEMEQWMQSKRDEFNVL